MSIPDFSNTHTSRQKNNVKNCLLGYHLIINIQTIHTHTKYAFILYKKALI